MNFTSTLDVADVARASKSWKPESILHHANALPEPLVTIIRRQMGKCIKWYIRSLWQPGSNARQLILALVPPGWFASIGIEMRKCQTFCRSQAYNFLGSPISVAQLSWQKGPIKRALHVPSFILLWLCKIRPPRASRVIWSIFRFSGNRCCKESCTSVIIV